jgi:hypothetical protein
MNRYVTSVLLLLLPQLARAAAGVADVAENDPVVFVAMMVLLLGFVGMIIAGLFIFAVLAGIVILMAAMGILSLSLFAGWYTRSVSKGVHTFFTLSFATMGGTGGLLLLLVLYLLHVSWVSSAEFCVSIVVAGALAGWVCLLIIKKILQRVFGK